MEDQQDREKQVEGKRQTRIVSAPEEFSELFSQMDDMRERLELLSMRFGGDPPMPRKNGAQKRRTVRRWRKPI